MTQKNLTMRSWIQNHILLELIRHASRRYTELKPRDVEGNLFLYHLQGLIKEGLVQKTDEAYTLSPKGLQFASTFSLATGKTRKQPKVLTAIACTNSQGEELLIHWHRQPNTGQVSLVYGLTHFGDTVTDMAAHELAEKAGLQAELRFLGDVYIRVWIDKEVDRHMLVHLFMATNPRPVDNAQLRPEVSESFWAKPETIASKDWVPGFWEVQQLAKQTDLPRLTELDIYR